MRTTEAKTRSEDDALVLGFPDIDPLSQPSRTMIRTIEGRLGARLLIAAQWPTADFEMLCTSLGDTARAGGRVICFGVGAGARAALLYGHALKATQITVWSPSAASNAGMLDMAAVEKAFGAFAPDRPELSVQISCAADTCDADFALARKLRPAAAGIRLERIETIPYAALEHALAQTGFAADLLAASLAGRRLPKPRNLDLRWRSAFAHRIELDELPRSASDGNGLEIRGSFQNASSQPFELDAFARDLVRIGARIFSPGDDRSQPRGARFTLEGGTLAPGAAIPFRLPIPAEAATRGFDACVAVVCDGRFWFDDHGFPSATLSIAANTLNARSNAA